MKWLKASSLLSTRGKSVPPQPLCTELASRDPRWNNTEQKGLDIPLSMLGCRAGPGPEIRVSYFPLLDWVNPCHDVLPLFKMQGNLVRCCQLCHSSSKTCHGFPQNQQHNVHVALDTLARFMVLYASLI